MSSSKFDVLPTIDPASFGFTGEDIRKINFDQRPDGSPIPHNAVLTDDYESVGVSMNGIVVANNVYEGPASPPNATTSAFVPGENQYYIFTEPVIAVGVINTSPDQDLIRFFSPEGEVIFETTDQLNQPKNFNIDRFVGARSNREQLIGAMELVNNTGQIELDELIFEVSTDQLPRGLFTYPVEAVDPDQDALLFSLLQKPGEMTINAATGFIYWNPTSMDIGEHPVTVRVEDAEGLFDEQSFVISVVSNENQPPVVDAGPDVVLPLGDVLTLNGTVTDDGKPAEGTLSTFWRLVDGPQSIYFSDPAALGSEVRFPQVGSYYLAVVANDGEAQVTDVLQVQVYDPELPEVLVDYRSSGWRYKNVSQFAEQGFQDPTFDDSGWQTGASPFGNYPHGCPLSNEENIKVFWPANTDMLLRRKIYLPDDAINVRVRVAIDNDVQVWINGTDVSGGLRRGSGCAVEDRFIFTVPEEILLPGENHIAVRGHDFGFVTYLDVAVDYDVAGEVGDNRRPIVTVGPDRKVPTSVPAFLSGTVTDDGLPEGGSFTYQWILVDTFPKGLSASMLTPASLETEVTFQSAGEYGFRLVANDGELSGSQDITLFVTDANSAPLVNLEPLRETQVGETLLFKPEVYDDGLPFNTLTYEFSQVEGPSVVTFTQTTPGQAAAHFSLPGVYLLTASVSDGEFTTVANTRVLVSSPTAEFNEAPIANAGADFTVPAESSAILNGWGHDDGLPTGSLSFAWTQLEGPAPLALIDATNAVTTVSFPLPGTYRLELSVYDGEFTSRDEVQVTVTEPLSNEPPVVDLGPDQVILFGDALVLPDNVMDDGLPNGKLLYQWVKISGPGSVTFGYVPSGEDFSLNFSVAGLYKLRLKVSDGELSSYDELFVTVAPAGSSEPVITLTAPQPDAVLPPDQPVDLTVSTADPDGQVVKVEYFAGENSLGESLEAPFAFTWNTPPLGEHILTAVATDDSGTTGVSQQVKVFIGFAPPQLALLSPQDGATFRDNQNITLSATAYDPDGEVTQVEFFRNGTRVGVLTQEPYSLDMGMLSPGSYQFQARATDNAGLITDSPIHTVRVYSDPGIGPVAEIFSPLEADELTEPTTVIGTASSAILDFYELQFRAVENTGGTWTTFSTGQIPVENGALGTFDPTLLVNGLYEMRLRVYDLAGRGAQVQQKVLVSGGMKVGHFTVAFNDLDVPVAGLPVSVTRMYDSRRAAAGLQDDFGVGWSLDVNTIKIEKNIPLGSDWGYFLSGNFYFVAENEQHLVTITFPDGSVHKFQPQIYIKGSNLVGQPFFPIPATTPLEIRFDPLPGTTGTLTSRDLPAELFLQDFPAAGTPPGPETTLFLQPFDFATFSDAKLFEFTTRDGTVFTFNNKGRVESMQDENGNRVEITQDGIDHYRDGEPSPSTSITFHRDPHGRISEVVDPRGNSMFYAYQDPAQASSPLTSFEDRESNSVTYIYDDHPKLVGKNYLKDILDPRGVRAIRNEYDDDGRLLKTLDADGNETVYTHDLDGRTETITDRLGKVTSYSYDIRGNVIESLNAAGERTTYTYHTWSDGSLSELKTTETVHALVPDENGQMVQKDLTTSYFYEDDNPTTPAANDGLVRKMVDPLGNITTFSYDARGNLLTMTDPRAIAAGSSVPTLANTYYPGSSLLHTTTDSAGNVTIYTYEGDGQVASESRSVTKIDETGTASLETLTTSYDYDGNGYLNEMTDPLGHVTTYTNDAHGNQLTETTTRTAADGTVHTLVTENEYDALDRLVRSWNAENPRATATQSSSETVYNAIGQPAQIYDELRRVTSFTYNDRGELFLTTYPDDTTEQVIYDAEGRREISTDRRSKQTKVEYDNVGRQLKTWFLGDPAAGDSPVLLGETVYDAAGRVWQSIDANGNATTFAYDDAGRRVAVLDALNQLTEYEYDANGNMRYMHDALGRTIEHVYDELNRRVATIHPATEIDDDGTVRTVAAETRTQYDELGRRIREFEMSPVDQPLAERKSTRFVYDNLGRLTHVVNALGHTTAYTYDQLGNQLTQTDAKGHTTTYTYDNLNRRTHRELPGGQVEVSFYDEAGNLRFQTDFNGATTEFRYDVANRLTFKIPDPVFFPNATTIE